MQRMKVAVFFIFNGALGMQKRSALFFFSQFLLLGNVTAESIHLEPSKLNVLSIQREHIGLLIKKLDISNTMLATLQSELNVNQESVRVLEIKSKEARDNLEKKQKYDRENPGEITDKLPQAHEKNRQVTNDLKEAKAKTVEIKQSIVEVNKSLSTQNAELNRLRQIFESDIESIVGRELRFKVQKLQISKKIEASGQVSCGEDSIRVCKERSKKEAERNAVEQGSVIDFSALTEVKNYKLTKEELKSEVHATLTSEEVIQQKIIDESTGYTQIRVTVNPIISEALRKKIASDIRADIYNILGGAIDYVSEQSTGRESVNALLVKDKNQRRIPPAGKNLVRIGQVNAIKLHYGYLVVSLDNSKEVAEVDEVVIVKNGKQFFGFSEKRLGSNVSVTLDEDDLRRIENNDAVFVYQ